MSDTDHNCFKKLTADRKWKADSDLCGLRQWRVSRYSFLTVGEQLFQVWCRDLQPWTHKADVCVTVFGINLQKRLAEFGLISLKVWFKCVSWAFFKLESSLWETFSWILGNAMKLQKTERGKTLSCLHFCAFAQQWDLIVGEVQASSFLLLRYSM